MFTLDVVLGFIKAFWKPTLILVVVCVIVGFIWNWHSRGVRLEEALEDASTAVERAREWRKEATECSAATAKLKLDNLVFEKTLADALARPPVEVIRYRERIKTVTETVVSDDCPTAVAQMSVMLTDLPACGGGL